MLKQTQVTLEDTPLELLSEHPANSNFMGTVLLKKLRRHIENTGSYKVYVMNADGTNETRLTNNTADDIQPAWGP